MKLVVSSGERLGSVVRRESGVDRRRCRRALGAGNGRLAGHWLNGAGSRRANCRAAFRHSGPAAGDLYRLMESGSDAEDCRRDGHWDGHAMHCYICTPRADAIALQCTLCSRTHLATLSHNLLRSHHVASLELT